MADEKSNLEFVPANPDEKFFVSNTPDGYTEMATNELRWVRPSRTSTEPSRLQQAWLITRYKNGKVVGRAGEWRDVPLVIVD